MEPFSVCLASTPLRASGAGLQHVVDSLLSQKPSAPSHIVLTIPRALQRPGQPAVTLAAASLKWAYTAPYVSTLRVNLIDASEDMGPATKLLGCLPTLQKNASTSCVLVTDDDAPRPEWWANAMCTRQLTHGVKAVTGGVRGAPTSADPSLHVQGNRGFAFRPETLDHASLLRFATAHHRACSHVDDQLFTAFFRAHKIPILPLCRAAIPRSSSTTSRCEQPRDGELLQGGKYVEGGRGTGLRHRSAISGRTTVIRCYHDTLKSAAAGDTSGGGESADAKGRAALRAPPLLLITIGAALGALLLSQSGLLHPRSLTRGLLFAGGLLGVGLVVAVLIVRGMESEAGRAMDARLRTRW